MVTSFFIKIKDFAAAILNLAISERTVRDRAGCPLDLDSAYQNT